MSSWSWELLPSLFWSKEWPQKPAGPTFWILWSTPSCLELAFLPPTVMDLELLQMRLWCSGNERGWRVCIPRPKFPWPRGPLRSPTESWLLCWSVDLILIGEDKIWGPVVEMHWVGLSNCWLTGENKLWTVLLSWHLVPNFPVLAWKRAK